MFTVLNWNNPIKKGSSGEVGLDKVLSFGYITTFLPVVIDKNNFVETDSNTEIFKGNFSLHES